MSAKRHEICIFLEEPPEKYAEVSPTESFEFGRMLEMQYDVLVKVFSYLTSHDLRRAALVDPTWEKAANRELQVRRFPAWSSCVGLKRGWLVNHGLEYKYANTGLCLITYCPTIITLQKYACYHSEVGVRRMSFAEYLDQHVAPPGVEFCTVSCTSALPCNADCNYQQLMYQATCIPHIPNIRMNMSYYNSKDKTDINLYQEGEKLRCMLLFTQYYRASVAKTLFATIMEKQPLSTVALGGGLVKSTKTFRREPNRRVFKKNDLFCITFTEKEGEPADFDAYSVVIQSDENETSESGALKTFEADLVKFKQSCTLRKHGVVFRFCCFAKDFKDREREFLCKHFPGYTQMAVEVDGEIGWTTENVPESDSDLQYINPKLRAKAAVDSLYRVTREILQTIKSISSIAKLFGVDSDNDIDYICDKVKHETTLYVIEELPDLPFKEHWMHVSSLTDSSLEKKYKHLCIIVNCILTISHGNAAPERGFSINKHLLEHKQSLDEETIIAVRMVKVQINHFDNDVSQFPISNILIDNVRASNKRYKEYIVKKKELENLTRKHEIKRNQQAEEEKEKKAVEDSFKQHKRKMSCAEDVLEKGNAKLQDIEHNVAAKKKKQLLIESQTMIAMALSEIKRHKSQIKTLEDTREQLLSKKQKTSA